MAEQAFGLKQLLDPADLAGPAAAASRESTMDPAALQSPRMQKMMNVTTDERSVITYVAVLAPPARRPRPPHVSRHSPARCRYVAKLGGRCASTASPSAQPPPNGAPRLKRPRRR